jgi:heme/copper-type cytochrome/quinol oxidase subunit 2
MNTFAAVIVLSGYLAAAQRRFRERTGDPEAGLTTLEVAWLTVGLIVIAGLLVVAITAAVQRRINLIN